MMQFQMSIFCKKCAARKRKTAKKWLATLARRKSSSTLSIDTRLTVLYVENCQRNVMFVLTQCYFPQFCLLPDPMTSNSVKKSLATLASSVVFPLSTCQLYWLCSTSSLLSLVHQVIIGNSTSLLQQSEDISLTSDSALPILTSFPRQVYSTRH